MRVDDIRHEVLQDDGQLGADRGDGAGCVEAPLPEIRKGQVAHVKKLRAAVRPALQKRPPLRSGRSQRLSKRDLDDDPHSVAQSGVCFHLVMDE